MRRLTKRYFDVLEKFMETRKNRKYDYSIGEFKDNAICIEETDKNMFIVYKVVDGEKFWEKRFFKILNACKYFIYSVVFDISICKMSYEKFVKMIEEDSYEYNKYLDDLGIPIQKYSTNYITNTDKRAFDWEDEKALYGFDNRETWNLQHTFIEWLYSHLMMYCEVNIIDTTYHKIEWNGEILTQQQCIDLLIDACREYLKDVDEDDYSNFERVCELMPLWGKLLPYMWW